MKKKDEAIIDILKSVQNQDQDNFIYVVPNIFVRKVKSYMLIREDLIFLTKVVQAMVANKNGLSPDDTIGLALWQSLIITYGKCFTENKGSMSKLDESLFEDKDEKYLAIHGKLMQLRHSYVAHRDDTEREQALVFMKVPKNEEIGEYTEYHIRSRKLVSPSLNELNAYLELLEMLIERVEEKIQKQTQKAHSAFLKEIPVKYINFLLVNNMR